MRYQLFRNTVEMVKKHNESFEKGEESFSMAVNYFADWVCARHFIYLLNYKYKIELLK